MTNGGDARKAIETLRSKLTAEDKAAARALWGDALVDANSITATSVLEVEGSAAAKIGALGFGLVASCLAALLLL